MLIHVNGWPGVGKLTVARLLAERLHARVLDNHSFYNVAFALTVFGSSEFFETVRAVRTVAFDRIARIDPEIPVVITNALTDCEWGRENRQAVQELAFRRGCRLFEVTLDCSREQNVRRVDSVERAYLGKLTDPGIIKAMRDAGNLLNFTNETLKFDTTSLQPLDVVQRILAVLPGD